MQELASSSIYNPSPTQALLTATDVAVALLVEKCQELNKDGLPLKLITAVDDRQSTNSFVLLYIFGDPTNHTFRTLVTTVTGTNQVPSIARYIPAAQNFERKLQTFFGLQFLGLPDPRPLLLHDNWPTNHYPLRKDFSLKNLSTSRQDVYQFTQLEGVGIYEIPVGPVHAGVIEPGHFRFSVSGEEILSLEPRLGYVHKGIEKLFEKLPLAQKVQLAEQVSGDSAFSHSLAFCLATESLAGSTVPARAQLLRVIYAELERLANHFNDIGFILMDTGFSFGGMANSRLREQIMQWNEHLSGNRFLRGINQVGGVTVDIVPELRTELQADLRRMRQDFLEIIEVVNQTDSVLNRLQETGVLRSEVAHDLAVVGVAARASGIMTETRIDYPYAAYDRLSIDPIHKTAGDVYARFTVRIEEVVNSFDLIQSALDLLKDAPQAMMATYEGTLPKHSYALGAVEGWRGEILYLVVTDAAGSISRVDARDPSFMNWAAVPSAVQGNMVPDFPLINKSFNLSYSGHDL